MTTEFKFREPEPMLDNSFSRVVVVDNIPIVTPEKYEKLLRVVTRALSSIGPLSPDPSGAFIPRDEKGDTKGFGFFEYLSEEHAKECHAKMQGYALDRAHAFRIFMFSDFERTESTPAEYVPPQVKPYIERDNLRAWLQDPAVIKGSDEFLLQHGEETEIWKNIPKQPGKPEAVMRKIKFTENMAKWSPQGTFLASLHRQGIMLWAGQVIDKAPRMKLPHQEVVHVDFSPSEHFAVTRRQPIADNDPQAIMMWDLRTAKAIRSFNTSEKVTDKPAFEWSSDDKYFVRKGVGTSAGAVEVYETQTMQMTPIKVPGMTKMAVSPKDPMVAVFTPQSGSTASRVAIIDLKTKKEVRAHNLQNGTGCEFFWQSEGDILCARIDTAVKGKKPTPNFVLFRLREKGIAVELLEGVLDGVVQAFAWEPMGRRFCLATAEGTAMSRATVQMFEAQEKKSAMVAKLERRPANHIFWAPQGGFIVFADLVSSNGALEFFNANTKETMATSQHFNASSVEWDPSGRFVAVVTSFVKMPKGDCGFNLFTFHGVLIQKLIRARFYQFSWRPRPPSLLSAERQAEIKKNLKAHRQAFIQDERREHEVVRRREAARLAAERDAFNAILAVAIEEYNKEAPIRQSLHGGSDDQFEVIEEVTEEVIEEIITKL